jgi:DNA polymerase III subunit epsilon
VVHLDPDARVTGEFSTLIDPRRDVGLTRIHGIRASDVAGAPTFPAAAATIGQLLAGRVFVAHNARFDAMFLSGEFARCGMQLPPAPVMCTMQLAGYYLGSLPARTLPACCQAAGVTLSGHHSALADARAAAGLLTCYYRFHRGLPRSWQQALLEAYLAVLDAVLEDRIITPLEVARLLGVPATEAEVILREASACTAIALNRDPSRLLQAGDRVVFTGDMDTSRTEIEALATADGLRVTSSVSRRLHSLWPPTPTPSQAKPPPREPSASGWSPSTSSSTSSTTAGKTLPPRPRPLSSWPPRAQACSQETIAATTPADDTHPSWVTTDI